MPVSQSEAQWTMQYQLQPIFLANGIAANVPGGKISIVNLTESAAFVNGIVGGAQISQDDFFANFTPMSGIRFDAELRAEIEAWATEQDLSFADAVRQLVRMGLKRKR